MSRLLHEIDRNQEQVRTIDCAIEDIEMIQALQPDTFGSDALSVAIDCMMIQRTRLLRNLSTLKALHDSPIPERDEVGEALLRQRQAASDALSVAIDCMMIQRTRLLRNLSTLKALHDLPIPERDEVGEALLRQRQAASDALSVAIDCMMIQRTRLLRNLSTLKATKCST